MRRVVALVSVVVVALAVYAAYLFVRGEHASSGQPRAFVINLERERGQLVKFRKQNPKLEFERYDAFDGKAYVRANPTRKVHFFSTDGRFGCYSSHWGLMRKISAELGLDEWAFIFEDDAIVEGAFYKDWPHLAESAKKMGGDVVFLSRRAPKGDTGAKVREPTLEIVTEQFYGAYAYAVTGRGARQILDCVAGPFETLQAWDLIFVPQACFRVLGVRHPRHGIGGYVPHLIHKKISTTEER